MLKWLIMSEMVSKSKQVTKDVSQDDQRATSAPSTLAASVSFALDAHTVFVTLVAFRLLNALTICTFFQPDEYFQALEPAWRWAFGKEAGAWITWVRYKEGYTKMQDTKLIKNLGVEQPPTLCFAPGSFWGILSDCQLPC